ncbi:MAG TPA: hypothetical protein VMA35_00940 [Candidatus Sulfopaludibacter sp.]|nr:hypothetical protein [Candidatus Sulfopaludibacter sp.]
MKMTFKLISNKLSLTLLVALGTASAAFAQGDIPSGTIIGSGSGPFNYSLTFSDAAGAGSSIGSVWYAWIPDQFFLPGTPTSASAPTGWTASIIANSIQFSASSSAYDIAPGHSLSGFGYTATFSPTTLAGTPNSGESDAYVGGIETDAGEIFTVQAAPEPSTPGFLGAGALGLALAGRRKSLKPAAASRN